MGYTAVPFDALLMNTTKYFATPLDISSIGAQPSLFTISRVSGLCDKVNFGIFCVVSFPWEHAWQEGSLLTPEMLKSDTVLWKNLESILSWWTWPKRSCPIIRLTRNIVSDIWIYRDVQSVQKFPFILPGAKIVSPFEIVTPWNWNELVKPRLASVPTGGSEIWRVGTYSTLSKQHFFSGPSTLMPISTYPRPSAQITDVSSISTSIKDIHRKVENEERIGFI